MDTSKGISNSLDLRRCRSLRNNISKSSLSGVSRLGSGSGKTRSRSRQHLEENCAIRNMTSTQKTSLVCSWKAIKPNANSLMRKIFIELEAVAPKVKQIFAKAAILDCFAKETSESKSGTIDEHVKLFTKFMDDVILNLDRETEVKNIIRKVGQSHAVLNNSCSFHSNLWEHLGEIAMQKICQLDAIQKSRETCKAWRMLIAFVTDEVRSAYDEQVKIARRSSVDVQKETNNEGDFYDKMKNLQLHEEDGYDSK
ncbi:Globin family and Globin-like domain and Globin, structural domain-containing protein [Strongyloides ratti]|uniref:Globin family and Globin-like domain and Globin, structural domain-containing protein n=1 Tax=Strongyloides ratti TaxID=34506 RepID=A0A090LLY1_STRRB|nr:Globin family and Globin-like domain and Globin, structural domain-containing protein [Strongyloides ratti]CEF70840.1 Globin family and Globin-like domain and Globin, structural domain-containing protein [Strongyloides ratti]